MNLSKIHDRQAKRIRVLAIQAQKEVKLTLLRRGRGVRRAVKVGIMYIAPFFPIRRRDISVGQILSEARDGLAGAAARRGQPVAGGVSQGLVLVGDRRVARGQHGDDVGRAAGVAPAAAVAPTSAGHHLRIQVANQGAIQKIRVTRTLCRA